ncbi:MAG: hypothetical protein ACRDOK_17665 [Streptosporangiaceae bacterium]
MGRALFGADLASAVPAAGKMMAAGQWLGLLAASLPGLSGPAGTRLVRAAAPRFMGAALQQQVVRLIARGKEDPEPAAGLPGGTDDD